LNIGQLLTAATELGRDAVLFLAAIAWPALVVVAILLLRDPLSSFLVGLGQGRGLKVSAFGIALEIPPDAIEQPRSPVAAFDELVQLSPDPGQSLSPSYAKSLIEEMRGVEPYHHAYLDLKGGGAWLTSRLFLVAALFPRMRGLEEIVFVQTNNGVARSYVAHAPAHAIRWRLAEKFPWFEQALALQYSVLGPILIIQSPEGRLDSDQAGSLLNSFLKDQRIQLPKTAPKANPSEWVDLQPRNPSDPVTTEEHAQWLNGATLSEIFEGLLDYECVRDATVLSDAEKASRVVRLSGPFVALVDTAGRFTGMVDRQKFLDDLGRELDRSRKSRVG
jgi:hypothetical protein